jgi:hypothetical protein
VRPIPRYDCAAYEMCVERIRLLKTTNPWQVSVLFGIQRARPLSCDASSTLKMVVAGSSESLALTDRSARPFVQETEVHLCLQLGSGQCSEWINHTPLQKPLLEVRVLDVTEWSGGNVLTCRRDILLPSLMSKSKVSKQPSLFLNLCEHSVKRFLTARINRSPG